MKQCIKCICDEKFPGISFDENGICNFCNNYQTKEERDFLKKRYEKKFLDLIDKYRGLNSYDCLVAYSGGKDSTYTIHLLKEKYKLRILALSYDNWFQSETAIKNISQVLKNLDVDLISVKPRYSIFKKIIKTVVENNFYSIKNVQRASDICTTCISLIRFQCFKTAIEKNIPFVIFGMSPGQAPIVTSVVKTNPQMVEKMQDIVYKPLKEIIGDDVKSFFLEGKHFKSEFFPYSINPLSFNEYNEGEILEKIKSFGWKNPADTDPNSTNCLLNALANHIHLKKYGFNPYCYELSELIRNNKITRDEALKKLDVIENKEIIDLISNEIGIK